MRTNIDLDEHLVKKAFQFSNAKTKKELIHQALKEFVDSRRRKNLLDLEGKVKFINDYDYKKLRIGK